MGGVDVGGKEHLPHRLKVWAFNTAVVFLKKVWKKKEGENSKEIDEDDFEISVN